MGSPNERSGLLIIKNWLSLPADEVPRWKVPSGAWTSPITMNAHVSPCHFSARRRGGWCLNALKRWAGRHTPTIRSKWDIGRSGFGCRSSTNCFVVGGKSRPSRVVHKGKLSGTKDFLKLFKADAERKAAITAFCMPWRRVKWRKVISS